MMGPLALAVVAGVVSFASPCCLPLMPGYVSYVSGVAGAAEAVGATTGRVTLLGSASLFVLGFATIFTGMGASASLLGSTLLTNRLLLTRVAGVFVVAMGLVTMGVLRE